jgi:hypothetical protein
MQLLVVIRINYPLGEMPDGLQIKKDIYLDVKDVQDGIETANRVRSDELIPVAILGDRDILYPFPGIKWVSQKWNEGEKKVFEGGREMLNYFDELDGRWFAWCVFSEGEIISAYSVKPMID